MQIKIDRKSLKSFEVFRISLFHLAFTGLCLLKNL